MTALGGDFPELVLGEVGEVGRVGVGHCLRSEEGLKAVMWFRREENVE